MGTRIKRAKIQRAPRHATSAIVNTGKGKAAARGLAVGGEGVGGNHNGLHAFRGSFWAIRAGRRYNTIRNWGNKVGC